MKEVIITIFGFILSLIISIAVMLYGWGLDPKSWWWIIGGGILLRGIIEITMAAGRQKNVESD